MELDILYFQTKMLTVERSGQLDSYWGQASETKRVSHPELVEG